MSVGYSGTPLSKKLGIKTGMKLVTINAPSNYEELIEPVPEDVEIGELNGQITDVAADILHLFANSRDELFSVLSRADTLIKQNGMIWVSWYKKASKLPTEVTEDLIREAALAIGLVDVKVCAVDEKWSGLKLVIRKANRI